MNEDVKTVLLSVAADLIVYAIVKVIERIEEKRQPRRGSTAKHMRRD